MDKALQFIKSHTLALACGVVALIAIGVYFLWIPGLIEGVKAKVNTETVEPLAAIQKLKGATRTLPKVADAPGEAPALTEFPTQRAVEQGTDALKRLKEQAAAALVEVRKVNERKPLVPNALPDTSTIARQAFYDEYRRVTAQTGPEAANGIIATVLHGALPPTDADLKAIGDARANEIYTQQLQRDATGKPVNQQQVDAAVAAMRGRLETEQRIGRARASKIYVNADAVTIHPFITQPVGALTPSTIFNAQVSLWLQQIAFEALADCNANAKDVLDAPVKHLIRLEVPMEVAPVSGNSGSIGFGAPASGDAAAADPAAAAAALTPDPAAAITPSYLNSPYGYGHTSLFDAEPISMIVRLDVRQLPQILDTLGRGRLLKVNNVNIRTVDTGAALAQKFIYDQSGKTPIVEVRIDCDVLLLRTWLVPLMPKDVKAYFANLSNPTPAAS